MDRKLSQALQEKLHEAKMLYRDSFHGVAYRSDADPKKLSSCDQAEVFIQAVKLVDDVLVELQKEEDKNEYQRRNY